MTETKADTVGYKRPPKEHRFRPGQSGNPGGRPKGARSFKSDLRDELSELINFQDGENQHTVSKQRALIKRLVASASLASSVHFAWNLCPHVRGCR